MKSFIKYLFKYFKIENLKKNKKELLKIYNNNEIVYDKHNTVPERIEIEGNNNVLVFISPIKNGYPKFINIKGDNNKIIFNFDRNGHYYNSNDLEDIEIVSNKIHINNTIELIGDPLQKIKITNIILKNCILNFEKGNFSFKNAVLKFKTNKNNAKKIHIYDSELNVDINKFFKNIILEKCNVILNNSTDFFLNKNGMIYNEININEINNSILKINFFDFVNNNFTNNYNNTKNITLYLISKEIHNSTIEYQDYLHINCDKIQNTEIISKKLDINITHIQNCYIMRAVNIYSQKVLNSTIKSYIDAETNLVKIETSINNNFILYLKNRINIEINECKSNIFKFIGFILNETPITFEGEFKNNKNNLFYFSNEKILKKINIINNVFRYLIDKELNIFNKQKSKIFNI